MAAMRYLILLSALLLPACGWYEPGVPKAVAEADYAACLQESLREETYFPREPVFWRLSRFSQDWYPAADFLTVSGEEPRTRPCMRAQGYHLVPFADVGKG
jgi:hypothetical protein